MFGKEQLMGIFQSLPTSQMITALCNAGVNINQSLIDEKSLLDDLGEPQEPNSWNNMRVDLWAQDTRPKNMLDPSKIVRLEPGRVTIGDSSPYGPDTDGLFTHEMLSNAQGGM